MARTELGLTLFVLAALSGCSLIIKDVTPPACTVDAECEVLNTTPGDKTITACLRYQCDGRGGATGTCVYRPLDADDDGQTSAMCPNGRDCDDSNPAIFLGNPEVCDGYDNNCDLVIDDGDIAADGAAELRDVTGAASVTWGTGGSTTFSTASTTYVFTLAADGALVPARQVEPTTNQVCPAGTSGCTGSGATQLANQGVQPTPSCLGRGPEWISNAAECASGSECPQPVCIRPPPPDGSTTTPIGRCADLDGGFPTPCRADVDCAWPCASERCVPPARDDVTLRPGCTLVDLATSPIGSDGAFAVGIETSGCRAGRLRAGWLANDGELRMFGPEARSNIWLGIDVGAFAADAGAYVACSGADRPSGTPGAARPAVAALGPDGAPQALAVYLGDSRERSQCGDAVAVPVEGIGLLRETRPSPTVNTWVTGSNDGHPETFGDTNGGGAPAVAALGDVGWIVGYSQATPSGGTPIALHFVGRVARPTAFTESIADGGEVWPAHERRPTVALAPSAPFLVPAAGRADYVSLAIGSQHGQNAVTCGVDGGAIGTCGATCPGDSPVIATRCDATCGVGCSYDVGVTWMEGCADAGMESVWFSMVRFDPAMPTGAVATDPVQLSTGTALGGFPSIVYAGGPSPFVSPNWSRVMGGAPVAAGARGGFVVAWAGTGPTSTRTAVYGLRISEADGLPVDLAPLQLQPMDATGTRAASVSLYTTPDAPNGTVSFGYWDRGTLIGGGRLICPAM